MRRLGHEVVPAGSTHAGPVDVILHEPGPGTGAGSDPRAAHPGAELVVVSVYPASETTASLSPAAFLLKPFSARELAHALAAALPADRSSVPALAAV